MSAAYDSAMAEDVAVGEWQPGENQKHHACTLQSRHAIRVDGKKSHLIGTAICEA
jgi:hypothetical protein